MTALGSQKNGSDLDFCASLACGSVSCGKYRFERASSELLPALFVQSFRTSWLPVPEDPGREPNERCYCVLFQQQQQNKCLTGYSFSNDRMWKQLHAGQASGNTFNVAQQTTSVSNCMHWHKIHVQRTLKIPSTTHKNAAHSGQPSSPGTEQNWFVALQNG